MELEEKLRVMVHDLYKLTSHEEIVESLQKISKEIMTSCIVFKDATIVKPLWIEAYYYNPQIFEDNNCHKNKSQKNNFMNIYIHKKGYGGFDLVLSDSNNVFLSFLIKSSIMNNEEKSFKQIAGKNKIQDKELNVTLIQCDESSEDIVFCHRINLIDESYNYDLASYNNRYVHTKKVNAKSLTKYNSIDGKLTNKNY